MAAQETVGAVAGIVQNLPLLLSVVQPIVYLTAVLFFGSIAVLGWRGHLPPLRRLLLRLAMGAICVVSGTAIGPFVKVDNALFRLMQADVFLAMFVSSLVLLVSLRLMTLSIPYSAMLRERIRQLQEKLEKCSDRDRKDGGRLRHPATLLGLAIFIGLIAISLANFRGFPDFGQNMFSSLGISESDMADINEAIRSFQNSPLSNLSPACLSSISLQNRPELFRNPPAYDNPALEAQIEQKSGERVLEMYRIDSDGKTLIVSVLNSSRQCFATPGEFCMCQ